VSTLARVRRRLRPPEPEPAPRLDEVLRVAHGDLLDAIDAAPDPVARLAESAGDDLWALAHSQDYGGWPRLRAALPAVPPPDLQRIWNGRDGASLAEQSLAFLRLLREVAGGFDGRRVLDFGCGWGRLTRLLTREVPPERLYGCDPFELMLGHRVPATLAVHDPRSERLPFDGPFDLAFAFSVFTHLSEAAAERAITALHAGLRPGGLLVITVRPPSWLPGDGSFRFVPHEGGGFHPQRDDGPMDYGEAVVELSHVRERWAPRFALRETRVLAGDPQQLVLVLERGT
jgi:SAM-dependent methyltransferase